jgi:acyl carrier protein
MKKSDIGKAVRDAILRTFPKASPEDESNGLSQETLKAWDSLGHLRLVLTLEQEFSLKFPTEVIPQLTSDDRIIDYLYQTLE